jgi:hypothetical protein
MKRIIANKKKIIVTTLAVLYYLAIIFYPFVLLGDHTIKPVVYPLSANCLIIKGQRITGPEIRIIRGSGFLKEAIVSPYPKDLNINEIELTGHSIYEILGYPDCYCYSFLVKGHVTGLTEKYKEADCGTIPVFEAYEVYPIMSLSGYLIYLAANSTLSISLVMLILVIILWVCPIVMLLYVVNKV